MADEPTTPGTPGQGGPEGDDAFDYARAYNELRPEFTRTTQELAEYRDGLSEYEQLFAALQDPSTQAEALASLGFEVGTGQPQGGSSDDEFVDPLEKTVEELRSQLNEVRSQQELEAAAQQDAEITALRDDFIGEAISYIEESTQRTFKAREEEVLGNLAIALTDEAGVPDVQAAYNMLYGNEGLVETARGDWIQTKTGAAQAPLGTSIPADKRPTTRAGRIQYMDERIRAQQDNL